MRENNYEEPKDILLIENNKFERIGVMWSIRTNINSSKSKDYIDEYCYRNGLDEDLL